MNTPSMHNQSVSSLRLASALALLAGTLAATGCAPVVTGGTNPGTGAADLGAAGGEPGDPPTSGHGGSGGGGSNAIAILESQMPTAGGGGASTGSSGGVGGFGVDPNTLYVEIANYGQLCGGDGPVDCTHGTQWQISVGIPPALQVPGVLQLSNPSLNSYMSATGSNDTSQPGDCWGGGGSFIGGTIEIVSIDQAEVVVRLQGTTLDVLPSSDPAPTADGEYTATRCFQGI